MNDRKKRSTIISPDGSTEDPLWYKDAIIYELHIKAFFDSNGDGIGDFEGLLQKLDYLQDLGITTIWLLPFYPSPQRDDGYDIADYYNINPAYGNIKVFKRFIEEAHKRSLKVITELVINHTSDQHPWFQRARSAPAGSRERDFYVWSDDPNKYKDVRIIFTDTEPSNWTWDPVAKQYFWHRFFSHQPDLNFDNPEVQEEVFKVLDYWFDMGVDGFRLDAIPYLFEREGTNCENLEPTHKFLKKLRKHVDDKYDNKLLLAEANMWPEDSVAYFGDGDECHMNYHFPIMPRMFMAVKMEDRYPIIDIIDQTPEIPDNCQWGIFLRNHDELTLEMVTDEERDYMYKVYTKDPQAKINVGIRHRLAPLLENNRAKMELMNVLLFSLPGTPIIYYGDEIGMGDNFYLGDRDGVRTPMQWNADRNAGFSKANPHRLYLPTIIDPEYRYEAINVEAQQMNGNSLLWWMKRIISMRKKFKAFGRGDIQFLSPNNAKVIAYTRSFESEEILVLGNLSRYPQAVELDLEEYEGHIPREVFSRNKFPRISDEPYLFTMAPYGYFWFILEKEEDYTEEGGKLSELKVDSWEEVLKGKNLKNLENKVLPPYLNTCRWFGGKAKVVQSMNVTHVHQMPVDEVSANLVTIEVVYTEGLPELYQLPLAFIPYQRDEEFRDIPQKAIISHLSVNDQDGMLVDGYFSDSFREAIFLAIKNRHEHEDEDGRLTFYTGNNITLEVDELYSKVLNAEQSNTSIIYSDKYFLKLYRKLDNTRNPDLEITRFLTEKAGYQYVPRFVGAFEYEYHKDGSMVLGMMQELVPNQGDAWEYTKDVISRYLERVAVRPKDLKPPSLSESIINPLDYNELDHDLKHLLGSIYHDRVQCLGERTAQMHVALASYPHEKDFEPEAFSLHYQRSVYSSLQSLTRSSFQLLKDKLDSLPEGIREDARSVLKMKNQVLEIFKKIFDHKINCMKIRTHGDYHLGQVLWTGKDFVLIDFEGEPARSYSERRLKRSPLRDVAGMIRSFHYAAYSAILRHGNGTSEEKAEREAWVETWYYYTTRFYMTGYLNAVNHHEFLPDNPDDFELLLEIFLLEKAVYELNYELNNRPDWVVIPLRGIQRIIEKYG